MPQYAPVICYYKSVFTYIMLSDMIRKCRLVTPIMEGRNFTQGDRHCLTSLFVSTVYFVLLCESQASTCKRLSACSCKTDAGGVIDLSALSNSDGTPRYVHVCYLLLLLY